LAKPLPVPPASYRQMQQLFLMEKGVNFFHPSVSKNVAHH
jgi:hypothetical protein